MFCRGLFLYHGGYSIMMGLGMLVNVLLIIWLITVLVRMFTCKTSQCHHISSNNFSALSTLNERLAKGEINEEEYTKLKSLITEIKDNKA